MAREFRISPDGNQVAVSTDYPDDGTMAFSVVDGSLGGKGTRWAMAREVELWGVVNLDTVEFPPSPEEQ